MVKNRQKYYIQIQYCT